MSLRNDDFRALLAKGSEGGKGGAAGSGKGKEGGADAAAAAKKKKERVYARAG